MCERFRWHMGTLKSSYDGGDSDDYGGDDDSGDDDGSENVTFIMPCICNQLNASGVDKPIYDKMTRCTTR